MISSETDAHYLSFTTPHTFLAEDAWSIAFWGKRAAGSTNRQGMVIGDLSGSDFIWLSDGGGGVSGIRYRNSSGGTYDNGSLAVDAFPDDGHWHHWAVVADGMGTLTVYRDAVSLGSVVAETSFEAVHVGQAYNANAQSMNGQIDELYIYREAISAARVGELFSASLPPAPAITAITRIGEGVWELTLAGTGDTAYEFRSSTTLDFTPGTLVTSLTQGNPGDPGVIGGANDSNITTDSNGDATVRMTLNGPTNFLRAQTLPPLLSENFEDGDGGFSVVTAAGTTDWQHGTPDSDGFGGQVTGGNGGSTACWGTNLGDFSGTGDPGYYGAGTDTCLRSAIIDLTGVDAARTQLRLRHRPRSGGQRDGQHRRLPPAPRLPRTSCPSAMTTRARPTGKRPARSPSRPPLSAGRSASSGACRAAAEPAADYMGCYIDDVTVRQVAAP